MKIAYCISAYTDPGQLARLVKSLHSDAHYFIHIDKNADVKQFESALGGGKYSLHKSIIYKMGNSFTSRLPNEFASNGNRLAGRRI